MFYPIFDTIYCMKVYLKHFNLYQTSFLFTLIQIENNMTIWKWSYDLKVQS